MAEYIAFYGTLMSSADEPAAPSHEGLSRFVAPCRIPGIMRDHGQYPGLFLEPSGTARHRVVGELHELLVPRALGVFDRWEAYDPLREDASLYLRRRIALSSPKVEAWVYLSQLSRGDPLVPCGNWVAYRDAVGR